MLTNLIIEPIGVAGFSSLGGLIDGTLDIPGALVNILGAINQANANTAIAEGRLLGGGLTPTLASPQQVSAKTVSTPAVEAKAPDPVSIGTPEVKSLVAKGSDEPASASTGSAPDSTGTSTTVDKDTPSADKDKTPTGTTDKDKPSAGDKDKPSSSDHDKG